MAAEQLDLEAEASSLLSQPHDSKSPSKAAKEKNKGLRAANQTHMFVVLKAKDRANVALETFRRLGTSSAAPSQSPTPAAPSASSKTTAARADAKAAADKFADIIASSAFGKFTPTHHPFIEQKYLALRTLLDLDNTDPDIEFTKNMKKGILTKLGNTMARLLSDTHGPGYIDPEKIMAMLLHNENCNVSLLFQLAAQRLGAGTKSGGSRHKAVSTISADSATVSTHTELWLQLTRQQQMNSSHVGYTGAQFVSALESWASYWFFLDFNVWFFLSTFLTKLNLLTRTTFGFDLGHADPTRHQDYLFELYSLVDAMVLESKNYAQESFDASCLNPLANVRGNMMLGQFENVSMELAPFVSSLLQVMRDKKTAYRTTQTPPIAGEIKSTAGRTLLCTLDGRLAVTKSSTKAKDAKMLEWCGDHRGTGCSKPTVTEVVGNTTFHGHFDSGRFRVHSR
jgi:hypothetical protein